MTPDEKRIVEWLEELSDVYLRKEEKNEDCRLKRHYKCMSEAISAAANAIQAGYHRKDKL